MVFPVVMFGSESWTMKKGECWRIDAFELWCWRRLLRVPWTARRSNQSILKEISPGCSLKDWCWGWNSNTLATSCGELTHWKRPWCWEGLGAGGEGDDRGWEGWMASPTRCTWVWVNFGNWWWTGRSGMLWFMGLQRVRRDWATELNWTVACGTLDPWPGIEPTTPALRVGVLTTGPTGLPGKFQCSGLTSSFFPKSSPVVDIPRIDFHLLRNHYFPGSMVSDVVCCCCLVDVMSNSSVTPWTVAHQAPLSMGFPGQEYWSGLPFPSPGHLPAPEIEPESPALTGKLFTTEPPGKPRWYGYCHQ